jgi:hypothetical protein
MLKAAFLAPTLDVDNSPHNYGEDEAILYGSSCFKDEKCL